MTSALRDQSDSPRSHTWNLMLLYCTVSTLNPIAASTQHTRHHFVESTNANLTIEMHRQVGKSEQELTWNRGDDLPHLQPICATTIKHTDQNRETLGRHQTADPGRTRGDSAGERREGQVDTHTEWWSCRHCRGRGRGCGPRGCRRPTRRAA
jgi:hypothetical protein